MEEKEAGWAAIWAQAAKNMEQGWSWSGFERSSTFLNDGTATFSDLSNVLGTDQVSDGRGVAAGDIDGDGDLDLVGTNSRTHPHVYVLRNDLETDRSFLLVDLIPSDRRSPAGAELYLTAAGTTQRRDVVLGSGFLSQHATTAHFGLGEARRITKFEVTWPDGAKESFTDLTPNRHIQIRQGSGEPRDLPLRDRNYNGTGKLADIEWDAQWNNLHLVDGIKPDLSQFEILDLEGETHSLAMGAAGLAPGGPAVLVNLWASWCSNCRAETDDLNALHAQAPEGLRVLGISLDEDEEADAVANARETWGIQFPVAHLRGEQKAAFLETLDPLLAREGGLSLPASLLLDPRGRVVAIAQGAFENEDLVRLVRSKRLTAQPPPSKANRRVK